MRIRAEISCAVYFLSSMATVQSVPMWRLTEAMVRSMLLTAWRLAISPTSTSPALEKATTDGVVRPPSALAMTVGSPPSRTETTELVVPRSIPTARDMCGFLLPWKRAAPGHRAEARRPGVNPGSSPSIVEARPLVERSALKSTQAHSDVNPKLSLIRSTLAGGTVFEHDGGADVGGFAPPNPGI